MLVFISSVFIGGMHLWCDGHKLLGRGLVGSCAAGANEVTEVTKHPAPGSEVLTPLDRIDRGVRLYESVCWSANEYQMMGEPYRVCMCVNMVSHTFQVLCVSVWRKQDICVLGVCAVD